MTEQQTETPPPAPEAGGDPTVDKLDARLDRLEQIVKDFIGGSGGSEPAADPDAEAADVKAETRRAVAEVKRREAAKAAREKEKADNEARIAAVEAKLKEKAPREYRKVTRFMRWEDEDKQ